VRAATCRLTHSLQRSNAITDSGALLLANALKKNFSLNDLVLVSAGSVGGWGKGRGGGRVIWLFALLRGVLLHMTCCVTHALQTANQISDVGARVLLELLESNTCLTELNLVSAGHARWRLFLWEGD